ncbi:MAG: hypothetical protein FJ388_06550, partial [Verrucomicrobia bacterium]|nr:hypothetical protein [Verrucomicrobiota bacterium]
MPKETEPSVPGSGKEAARQVVQPDNATVAAGPGAVTNVTPPTDVGGREKNDPASNALPETLRRGKKYEIGKVVARGGMGAILDAKETAIERSVAMKVMLDAESPDALARFVTEGKVTGQLEHPNIVPVHELGVDEQQQVFYTMKFVRGDTLRKVLEQLAAGDADTIRKYPLSHLLTIFQKVCDAMAFAHSKGVIHRDLKPENIMLGDFGEVLVMDWGLAKVVARHSNVETGREQVSATPGQAQLDIGMSSHGATMTGTIMGTPQYMPPEQAHGRIERLDARSDIYSLGAILYHILTLQPSVEGDDVMQVLFKVGNGQIVSPAQAVAAVYDRRSSSLERTAGGHRPPLQHLPGGRVPESLSAVVMKAMALKQEDRYQSVPELQRDIEAYQNGFATSAEHASLLRQLALLVKRHKREFGIGFAALLVLLGFSVWFVINLRVSERKATHNAEIATANEQKAIEEKENTRRALAKSQLALAEAAFREQDGPGMQAALNAVPEDLRDSNWNYLLAQSDTSIATIRSRRGDVWAAVPHPKKPGVFAIIGPEAWVTLVEVRTGARLLEFQADVREKKDLVYPLAISPDGDRLAIGDRSAGRIVMHSARDGRKLAEWETAHPTMLQFSPDGARLLEVVMEPKTGLGKQLNLWDAAAGRVLWEKKFQRPHAVFDPTGETLLVASARKLMILNVKDGALLRELPEVKEDLGHLCIHPDGARALAGRMKGFVRCLDLRDGRVLYEMRCGQQAPSALAYTPDGERFVTL